MALDDRLSDLLVDWEQSQRDGREPTLEELCKDAPELLPVVRESIDSLKATRWMLEQETGPTSADDRSTDGSRAALHDTELPASHLTVEQFAASIFQSGLLSPAEIQDLNERLTASHLPGEAREIASRLVTEGKLTRYQASVLLKASKDPLLIDNYVILDTLDTGGMGLVFKALHRSMNRVVALKLLPSAMMSARDTVKRFQREVQAAAALSHPNIVAAFDAHQSAEIAYLVLEYVEGRNLFRLVKEQGPLSVAVAANYARQAATGLAYLHSRGIIHRDVKPANLILAEEGTVKLLDMGLVRFASSEDLSCSEMDQELTQAGIVIGTVAYMSPEQALDTRSADQRSDIYSLGCTLFFLLTGRSLYHEETGMKTLLAHREQPVPTIREFCEEAPVSLDAVFRTMVSKRPADRLQTMTEVIAALDACVPGLAANAPTGNAPRRVALSTDAASFGRRTKPLRSSPAWIALVVVALAGLAAGGTYLAGILIRITSNKGTTEVFVDDPKATVEVTSDVAGTRGSESQGTVRAPVERKVQNWQPPTKGPVTQKTKSFIIGQKQTPQQIQNEQWGLPLGALAGGRSSEPSTDDIERRLATWATKLQGDVTTESGAFKSVSEVPKSPFHVYALDFEDNQLVDDAVLAELIKFRPPSLRGLDLSGTRITDKGMEGLGGIPHLIALGLSNTLITDEGVKTLSSVTSLQELDLAKTRITDKAIGFLAALPHITGLALNETQITDQALIHLPQLKSLSLDGTRITDAGLNRLENQTWLRSLEVVRTKVTKTGITRLQVALPNCEIKHEFWELNQPDAFVAPHQQTQAEPKSGPSPFRRKIGPPKRPRQQQAAPAAQQKIVSDLAERPRPKAPESVDRRVANWIRERAGGAVYTRENPAVPINPNQVLPPGDIHLEGIDVSETPDPFRYTTDDIERLGSLTGLKWLNLCSHSVTDRFVLGLNRLTKLERLSLQHANITDDCLAALAGMTRLSSLDLSDTARITDAGLEKLAALKSLNDLSLVPPDLQKGRLLFGDMIRRPLPDLMLDNTRTTEAGLFKLQEALPNCHIFVAHIYPGSSFLGLPLPPKPGSSDREWASWLLSQPMLNCKIRADLDPETLIVAPRGIPPIPFHIQSMDIGPPSSGELPTVNGFFFRRLADLKGLQSLHLLQRVSPAALRELGALKSLQTLELRDVKAGDETLQAISSATGLKSLTCDGAQITDAGIRSLAPLKGLTELNLTGNAQNVHGNGFESLSGLSALRSLALAGSGLDNDGARQIGRLAGLEKLDIQDTWISGAGLAGLSRLTHLKDLNLGHCRQLQAGDLAVLGGLSALETLDLSNCRLTNASLASLLGTFKKLSNLRTVWVRGTSVTGQIRPEFQGVLPRLQIMGVEYNAP